MTGEEIEKKSFEIITEKIAEIGGAHVNGNFEPSARELSVIKRCIHTTADLDYANSMCFSEGVTNLFDTLVKDGATIVTDTNMVLSGINKKKLSSFGCKIVCFMADEDVAQKAKERKVTRAAVSMERAACIEGPVIFAVGNAPTALMKLKELYDRKEYRPDLVIGVPVGFVNVVSSKEAIMQTDIPYIINRGQKGGSNVAAAIVNALVKDMT